MPPVPSPLRRLAPVLAPAVALLVAAPAHAHHPMDGRPVSTAFEGFLSGLAHPVIGVDHLAMIVAIGLLAAATRRGFLLAAGFVLAAMAGAGLHLLGLSVPGAEILIALSVLLAGGLLVLGRRVPAPVGVALVSAAGLLHGYAYGESIFGAEAAPLLAYLAGFTAIQLAVAGLAYAAARALRDPSNVREPALQPAGYVTAGVGLALVATQLVSLAFPVS